MAFTAFIVAKRVGAMAEWANSYVSEAEAHATAKQLADANPGHEYAVVDVQLTFHKIYSKPSAAPPETE